MIISLELTNNITGQDFSFKLEVSNWTQYYNRVSVIMYQLSIIENVNPENISHIITEKAA